MWQVVQVHYLESEKIKIKMGKLQKLSLGALEFSQTFGIAEKAYQATTVRSFRLEERKLAKLPWVEDRPIGKSPNQGFKNPMIGIQMGGVGVLLGLQWLQSLGTLDLNFKELSMTFSLEAKVFELRGKEFEHHKCVKKWKTWYNCTIMLTRCSNI